MVAFVVLHPWTFLLEVSLISALKTSRPLTRSGALLVVSVVGNSRTHTVTGDVTIFVAFIALWSTRTVMVGIHRHEWQRQAADDLAVQYIMRTQALEAGARVDTLEDTGSSS
ncbi:hypothetical protein Tco_0282426 [Tanacetum coccineum]